MLARVLATNKFLLFLDLTGNSIGNKGATILMEAITKSNTLQSLNLASNELEAGPKKIAMVQGDRDPRPK